MQVQAVDHIDNDNLHKHAGNSRVSGEARQVTLHLSLVATALQRATLLS